MPRSPRENAAIHGRPSPMPPMLPRVFPRCRPNSVDTGQRRRAGDSSPWPRGRASKGWLVAPFPLRARIRAAGRRRPASLPADTTKSAGGENLDRPASVCSTVAFLWQRQPGRRATPPRRCVPMGVELPGIDGDGTREGLSRPILRFERYLDLSDQGPTVPHLRYARRATREPASRPLWLCRAAAKSWQAPCPPGTESGSSLHSSIQAFSSPSGSFDSRLATAR